MKETDVVYKASCGAIYSHWLWYYIILCVQLSQHTPSCIWKLWEISRPPCNSWISALVRRAFHCYEMERKENFPETSGHAHVFSVYQKIMEASKRFNYRKGLFVHMSAGFLWLMKTLHWKNPRAACYVQKRALSLYALKLGKAKAQFYYLHSSVSKYVVQ